VVGFRDFDKLIVRRVLSPHVESLFNPFAEIVSAVIDNPIVRLAHGGQESIVGQLELIERIGTGRISLAILIFDVVYPNAYNSVASVPTLDDFMLNPRAASRFRSNKNRANRRVLQLIANPAFYRRVALSPD
jgi:hypothetical protein